MLYQNQHLRFVIVPILVGAILGTPMATLQAADSENSWKRDVLAGVHDVWEVSKAASSHGWKYAKGTAVTAYKITAEAATPALQTARDVAVDAANVTWVYSAARADDAWNWVVDKSDDAGNWAVDKAGRTWAVSRDAAGDLCVWTAVRLANSGPVSYVQTKFDDSWQWTTDKSGKAWVFVKDHAVEITVVAAVVAAFAACCYFTQPGQPSPCSYQSIRESLVGKYPSQLKPSTVDAISRQQFDTSANGNNYRRVFTSLQKIPEGYEVHHSYPQKYEDTMTAAGINIHNPWRLQGVDPQTHQAITREWSAWDRGLGYAPSAKEIMVFKETIDDKYGKKMLELGK